MANVYLYVDPVWSYNFISGIAGVMDIDHVVVNDLYQHACNYVQYKHNFALTGDPKPFNRLIESMSHALQTYPIETVYFLNGFNALYMNMRVGLFALEGTIEQITLINDAHGEINGMVCRIQPFLKPILQL